MIALVCGAAASGKSAVGEQLAVQLHESQHGKRGQLLYLATMLAAGVEAAHRIERHRALRANKGFTTLEIPRGLAQAATSVPGARRATLLLEDLGNLVANEMFPVVNNATLPPASAAENVTQVVLEGIAALEARCAHVIVVGNEVGGEECQSDEVRRYQEVLGACSCALAARAQLVIECVAGIEHILKGARP